MDVNHFSYFKVERSFGGLFIGLSHLACEWFLIFLMILDGTLSYLLTKFAAYCELQAPCFLCSRLDHVLGNEKPGYYRNFLCTIHRLEISSLIFCDIHEKLVDGLAVCEECLMSFTRKTNSNSNAQKLLIGKLGFDFDGRYGIHVYSGKPCTCCNIPCRKRETANRILQLKTPRSGMTKPNIPLPRRLTYRENLKKLRERSASVVSPGGKCYDPLSYIGYSELKLNSDSESEFPFSDDDDGTSTTHDMEPMDDLNVPHTSKPRVVGGKHGEGYSSDGIFTYYSDNHKRQQVFQKSPLPDLVLLDDIGPFSDTTESPIREPTEKREVKHADFQDSNRDDFHSESKDVQDIPKSSQTKSDGSVTGDIHNASIDHNEDSVKSKDSETEASKEGLKDVNKSPETEEQCLSSSASEAVGSNSDSEKTKALSSSEPQTDHNSSTLESQERSNRDGSEYESIIDKLKQQVEEDQKQIKSLYGELDEERNASAIAADEAMAMITRLQEEKASLQMEAWQDLRMLEEQAEHDAEALEKLNDLLTEREKELQDLEAELDFYRINYGDDPMDPMAEENLHLNRTIFSTNVQVGLNPPSTSSLTSEVLIDQMEEPNVAELSLSDFKEEKSFIEQSLLELERKLLSPDIKIFDDEKSSKDAKEVDMVGIENEVSDLNERLESLETNWNLLEHAFNSLQAGKEGLRFVQEIAHHLQELQKIRLGNYL